MKSINLNLCSAQKSLQWNENPTLSKIENHNEAFDSEIYEFTNEWFLGNVYDQGLEIDEIDIWRTLFVSHSNIFKILEIGSHEGHSTAFLCEHFGKLNGANITYVDT